MENVCYGGGSRRGGGRCDSEQAISEIEITATKWKIFPPQIFLQRMTDRCYNIIGQDTLVSITIFYFLGQGYTECSKEGVVWPVIPRRVFLCRIIFCLHFLYVHIMHKIRTNSSQIKIYSNSVFKHHTSHKHILTK